MRSTTTLAVLLLVTTTYAQSGAYAQCATFQRCSFDRQIKLTNVGGGKGWGGATTCVAGYVCTSSGEYYSQCVPGTAPVVSPTKASPSSNTTGAATAPVSTGTPGSGPGTTLQTGYYWIRAVEDPNFHKYLQTNPIYKPGLAVMESYTTAGQFQIVDGQLVELITGGFLYANVQQLGNSTLTKLAVTFLTTKNTYGSFMFSGDAVQWSAAGVTRQNLSAWLVCANQQLFINLGAYAYMTPAGCADETIHYYNAATASS